MKPVPAFLVTAGIAFVVGLSLLGFGFYTRTRMCTTMHGTLGECTVVYATWPVDSGLVLIAISFAAAAMAWGWSRTHPAPLP